MKRITLFSIIVFTCFSNLNTFGQNGYKLPDEIKQLNNIKSNIDIWDVTDSRSKLDYKLKASKESSGDFGNAPIYKWGETFGGTDDDIAKDIVTDSSGNLYVAGYFSGEITIEGQLYESVGVIDGLMLKLSSDGSIIWVKQFSPSNNEILKINGICIDDDDEIYITGSYRGDITLGSTDLLTDVELNLFYAELNSAGDVIFASSFNNNSSEEGEKIDIDSNGNVYIIGSVPNSKESILLKYNEDGDLMWQQDHMVEFSDLTIVGDKIYFVGVNHSTIGDLDGNIILGTPGFKYDIFYAKADLSGVFEWGKMFSHRGTSYANSKNPVITVDENKNIYIGGDFETDIIIGNDTLIGFEQISVFIAKCQHNGDFIWNDYYGHSSYRTSTTDICNQNDSLYLSTSNTLFSFDTSGVKLWEEVLESDPNAITVDSLGKINLCGDLDGQMNISQYSYISIKNWDNTFESNNGTGSILAMGIDQHNDIYSYGHMSDTEEFFGQELAEGIFISKQDSSGDIEWINHYSWSGWLGDCAVGDALYIDTVTSYVYITGELNDTLIIPNKDTLYPHSNGSIFFMKFDYSGNYILSVQENFEGDNISVTTDYSGNIILSGRYDEIISMGDTTIISEGGWDVFVAKYKSNGDFEWVKGMGGEDVEWRSMAVCDRYNYIYFTGEFVSENVSFTDDSITLHAGNGNILLTKISPNGGTEWIKSFGKSQDESEEYGCWPTGMTIDVDGDLIMRGWHGDSVYFDDHLLKSPYGMGYSKFLSKLDSDGNIIWINSINETYWELDYNQFDVDYYGNIYYGMEADDTLYFEDDYMYIPNGDDMVIAKYTTDGKLNWVKSFEGKPKEKNSIQSVMVDNQSNIYVGGFITDIINVDDHILAASDYNGFIIKLYEEPLPPTATICCASSSICEGDSILVSVKLTGIPPWNITYTDGVLDNTVSTNRNPYTFYTKSGGTYEVTTLSDVNFDGSDFGESAIVTVHELPTADFKVDINEFTATFTNSSSNASTFTWDFGDGITSTDVNPIHIYTNAGVYEVELSATSEYCGIALATDTVSIELTEIHDIINNETFRVFPNPSKGNFLLELQNINEECVQFEIYNSSGQIIYNGKSNSIDGTVKEKIDLNGCSSGVYIIHIKSNETFLGAIKLLIEH